MHHADNHNNNNYYYFAASVGQRISSTDNKEEDDDGIDYEQLRPTYTHEAIMLLLEKGYIKYVISQNGDGLHRLSGITKVSGIIV